MPKGSMPSFGVPVKESKLFYRIEGDDLRTENSSTWPRHSPRFLPHDRCHMGNTPPPPLARLERQPAHHVPGRVLLLAAAAAQNPDPRPLNNISIQQIIIKR
jgi:hypothetical protein